jgi:hypothetical protein
MSMSMRTTVFYLSAIIILTIACWLFASFLLGAMSPARIVLVILSWLFVAALVLAARKASASVWIYAGLLVLVGLFLPTSILVDIFPAHLSPPFETAMAITLFLILSAALVIAALLLRSSLNFCIERQNTGAVEGGFTHTTQARGQGCGGCLWPECTLARQDPPQPVLAHGLG